MDLDDVDALIEALFEDVTAAKADLAHQDNQYRRRALIRTTFAAIEGWTYALKRFALEIATEQPALFTVAELAVLREESYELQDHGRVHTRAKHLKTVPNIRFALRMMLRGWGEDESMADDIAPPGFWATVDRAQKVRDRITHPKHPRDLEISDEELELVETVHWGAVIIPVAPPAMRLIVEGLKHLFQQLRQGGSRSIEQQS